VIEERDAHRCRSKLCILLEERRAGNIAYHELKYWDKGEQPTKREKQQETTTWVFPQLYQCKTYQNANSREASNLPMSPNVFSCREASFLVKYDVSARTRVCLFRYRIAGGEVKRQYMCRSG
jgi:hypothetical protein